MKWHQEITKPYLVLSDLKKKSTIIFIFIPCILQWFSFKLQYCFAIGTSQPLLHIIYFGLIYLCNIVTHNMF